VCKSTLNIYNRLTIVDNFFKKRGATLTFSPNHLVVHLYQKNLCTYINNQAVFTPYGANLLVLPPFINIRCFSFVKQMYLDMF
jgi:hypothetical protein